VRDTGTVQRVAGGPAGHHYTCDVLWNRHVLSFRITLRSSDGMWVLDNWFQTQGRPGFFDPKLASPVTVELPSRPYNAMIPGFRTLGELLYAVHETRSFMRVDAGAGPTYN
jgi:hypothetical protein